MLWRPLVSARPRGRRHHHPAPLRLVNGEWEVTTWTRAEKSEVVEDAPSGSFYLDKEKELSKEEQARADKEFFDSVYDCDWFDCDHDHDSPPDL